MNETDFINAGAKGLVTGLFVAILAVAVYFLRKVWAAAKESPEKKNKIVFVISIAWVIIVGMNSSGYRGFDMSTFLFIGIMPVAGYWGYHLFFSKKS